MVTVGNMAVMLLMGVPIMKRNGTRSLLEPISAAVQLFVTL